MRGVTAELQGDYAAAASLMPEALALARQIEHTFLTGFILDQLGALAYAEGEVARAASLSEEGLRLLRQVGSASNVAVALHNLGRASRDQGDLHQAAAHYRESIALWAELGDAWFHCYALAGLASIATALGQMERAARLFGAAERLREAVGAPVWELDQAWYNRDVVALRSRLGPRTFAQVWAEGRALSVAQVVAEAEVVAPVVGEATETGGSEDAAPTSVLTPRELDVLRLLVAGRSNPEIAEVLFVSPATVHTHVNNIYRKLGVNSRAAAVDVAHRHGHLSVNPPGST
jgi:ATP/maltotriose-dependent transcriptional regulator MalT